MKEFETTSREYDKENEDVSSDNPFQVATTPKTRPKTSPMTKVNTQENEDPNQKEQRQFKSKLFQGNEDLLKALNDPIGKPSPHNIGRSKDKKISVSGKHVRLIQLALNKIATLQAYQNLPIIDPIDGVYGSQTEKAVLIFQQKHFADMTEGVVGPETLEMMDNILSTKIETPIVTVTKKNAITSDEIIDQAIVEAFENYGKLECEVSIPGYTYNGTQTPYPKIQLSEIKEKTNIAPSRYSSNPDYHERTNVIYEIGGTLIKAKSVMFFNSNTDKQLDIYDIDGPYINLWNAHLQFGDNSAVFLIKGPILTTEDKVLGKNLNVAQAHGRRIIAAVSMDMDEALKLKVIQELSEYRCVETHFDEVLKKNKNDKHAKKMLKWIKPIIEAREEFLQK